MKYDHLEKEDLKGYEQNYIYVFTKLSSACDYFVEMSECLHRKNNSNSKNIFNNSFLAFNSIIDIALDRCIDIELRNVMMNMKELAKRKHHFFNNKNKK